MNIHKRAAELVSLAQTYAEDGAFRSSARILRKLANELEAHAEALFDPAKRLARELASLNPSSGEIGEGKLRNIQDLARRVLPEPEQ